MRTSPGAIGGTSHLRRLPRYQRTADDQAGLRHAPHGFGDDLGAELAAREVIGEREGARPLDEEIAGTVIDEIHPDGVVSLAHDGDLELRADPVDRDGQHVAALRARGEPIESGEGAVTPEDVLVPRGPHGLAHQLDGLLSGVDVDARVAVARPLRL